MDMQARPLSINTENRRLSCYYKIKIRIKQRTTYNFIHEITKGVAIPIRACNVQTTGSTDMTGEEACTEVIEHRPVHNKTKKNQPSLEITEYAYNESDKGRDKKTKRTKSLSIELTGEMHKILKTVALKQDNTLNSLVIEALKQFLENEERLNRKAEELRKRLL